MIMNSSKPSEKTLALLLEYEVGGGQSYYERYLSKFTWPKELQALQLLLV